MRSRISNNACCSALLAFSLSVLVVGVTFSPLGALHAEEAVSGDVSSSPGVEVAVHSGSSVRSEDNSPSSQNNPTSSGENPEPSDGSAAASEKGSNPPAQAAGSSADEPEAAATKPPAETKHPLRIASWGGAYQSSQDKAYFTPFRKSSGIGIKTITHKQGSQGSLIESMKNGIDWDVADLTSRDVDEACEKGLIQPIELDKILDGDGLGREDFLPGAITKCGIGSVAWSSVIVVNRRKFRNRQPRTIRDFFNVSRFKGKRALPRSPKYLLEMALLADGVAAGEVYDVLDTSDGVDRAFKKLSEIREHILWWDHAGEPIRLLEQGKAVMALSYSGRAYSEITARSHPFDIVWDGQIYDVDYWVISKKARNQDVAQQFLRYALAPERLAAQARLFPYGPMRKSAVSLVGKHAYLDLDMARYLPTREKHLENAVRLNTKWWLSNGDRLKSRFDRWLRGEAEDRVAEDENAAETAGN